MKTIWLLLLLALTGCTIPGKTYHAIRASSERKKGIPSKDLPKALIIYDEQSPGLVEALRGSVIVLARFPQEMEVPKAESYLYHTPTALPPTAQQIIEANLVLELHRKGYRSASRLNAKPILVEKAFPSGRLRGSDLAELFKGAAMLLLTVNRFQYEDANYDGMKAFGAGTSRTRLAPR